MDSTPGLKRSTLAWAFVVLSACTPGEGPGQAASPSAPPTPYYQPQTARQLGGTVVMADWEAPAGFNVLAPATESELRAGRLLFAPLWGLDSKLNPYPDLVREVPTVQNGEVKPSADGQSLTIQVRLIPGLRWSDGTPITADDVIFTWNAICDPATRAAAPPGFDRLEAMDRRSDSELVWQLSSGPAGRCGGSSAVAGVYAGYLQMGAGLYVMPAHRLQPVPRAQWPAAYFLRPDVVSGPFGVAEVAPDHVTFSPNPGYSAGRSAPGGSSARGPRGPFDHQPYVSQVVLRVYPSRDAEVAAVAGGEVDLAFHLGATDLGLLQSLPSSTPLNDPGLRDEFLNPNHAANAATGREPPWVTAGATDRGVLDALSMALDRQALGRQAQGVDVAVTVSRGLFPSALSGYSDPGLSQGAPDLAGARRLLDQAGWVLSGQDPVRAKAGRRLDFEVLGVCGSASTDRELKFLHDAWAQVGASVRTGCRPRSQFFGGFAARGVNATGAFDMTVYSNSWGPDPDAWAPFAASDQVPTAALPGGGNWNRCRDPQLDQAFAEGAAALKAAPRRDAYLRAQREWLAYHCTVPLFEWPQLVQVSSRVRNFVQHPQAGLETWNATDWWLRG